jgi:hypothetical protein
MEILLLSEKLSPRYNPRFYIVASTDTISQHKIHTCEKVRSEDSQLTSLAEKSQVTLVKLSASIHTR